MTFTLRLWSNSIQWAWHRQHILKFLWYAWYCCCHSCMKPAMYFDIILNLVCIIPWYRWIQLSWSRRCYADRVMWEIYCKYTQRNLFKSDRRLVLLLLIIFGSILLNFLWEILSHQLSVIQPSLASNLPRQIECLSIYKNNITFDTNHRFYLSRLSDDHSFEWNTLKYNLHPNMSIQNS